MSRSMLLVDADASGSKLVTIVLRMDGWVVVPTTTAGEALGVLGSFMPDVIVTELQLPDASGLDLVHIVKTRAATRHIPIVVLTATNGLATERRVLAAGCAGYLHKPIDVATFATQLTTVLGES